MSFSNQNEKLNQADEVDDGYILGTVIENNDPNGWGRIKVSIPGLLDPAKGEVPWIGPHRTSPFGQGKGFGIYGSPAKGALVKVKFQDGKLAYGLAEADYYGAANANPKFASPQVWGYCDPAGNELIVNMATGVITRTDQNGNVVTQSGSGIDIQVNGALNVNISGDCNLTAGGNVNVKGAIINLN